MLKSHLPQNVIKKFSFQEINSCDKKKSSTQIIFRIYIFLCYYMTSKSKFVRNQHIKITNLRLNYICNKDPCSYFTIS